MDLPSPTPDGEMYEGYSMDLVTELAARVGFTFTFYLVPDGKYGVRQPDGHWDGIVGQFILGVSQPFIIRYDKIP